MMTTKTKNKPLAIIAGAGQGLGKALMNKFNDGGYQVVGLNRTIETADHSNALLLKVDLSSAEQVKETITDIISTYGAPKILVHNSAQLVIKPFLEHQIEDYENTWRSGVLSAALVAQNIIPAMLNNGGGSCIFSGATASLRGGKNFSAFASAKFALRGLTQSLAREFQPQGIHIAHAIIDGIIDTPKSRELHQLNPEQMMNPNDIAEAYWGIAHQPKSAWTHEFDLRNITEAF